MEEESCAKFQPFCKLFKLRAYVACKKTCKLCPDDKPKGVSESGNGVINIYNTSLILKRNRVHR